MSDSSDWINRHVGDDIDTADHSGYQRFTSVEALLRDLKAPEPGSLAPMSDAVEHIRANETPLLDRLRDADSSA